MKIDKNKIFCMLGVLLAMRLSSCRVEESKEEEPVLETGVVTGVVTEVETVKETEVGR